MLSVSSFDKKCVENWEEKSITILTIKAMLKNSLKRNDGKCKVVIRLNQKGQEASIKNEWYAIEPYTIKKENLNAV